MAEQFGAARAGEGRGGPLVVEPGAPQRLVGVDVADAADQRLVEQRPLDGGPAAAQRGVEGRVVEGGSSGSRAMCAMTSGSSVRRRDGVVQREAAEGALVDEAQLGASRRRSGPGPADASRPGRRRAGPAAGRSCRGGAQDRGVSGRRGRVRAAAATGTCRAGGPPRCGGPSSRAAKSSAPARWRRTARGCSTSTSATYGRRPSAPGRAGRPRPRAARAR